VSDGLPHGDGDKSGERVLSLAAVLPSTTEVHPSWLVPGKRAAAIAMMKTDLSDVYQRYIYCLNKQDWPRLDQFVHDDVHYNGQRFGVPRYRQMLERDFNEIPDLHFNIAQLISDPPWIASRLLFDCTPKGAFLGLPVNGKRVSFSENVFYQFRGEKIERVWSVIDKAAIEAQLGPTFSE
jgi:steroid delta-isomerase-like uncharacterized protein